MVLIDRGYINTKNTKKAQRSQRVINMGTEIIFKKVLDISFDVHKHLGPGLLESAYEACLFF